MKIHGKEAEAMTRRRLEVHTHWIVSGPRQHHADLKQRTIIHSHENGSTPHQHSDTGPAAYTVDKDEWKRATGLVGGGRKRFTAQPIGEQFPIVELEEWQKSFDVIVCEPSAPPGWKGSGGAIAATDRMIQTFRMKANVRRA